jgi:uncharacterized RDD family membrane protein YckC
MSPVNPDTLYCTECGRPNAPDELARFGTVLVCPACKPAYAQKLREGVLPHTAVEYGGFWIRFLASVIDWIILTVVASIIQFGLLGSMLTRMRPQPGLTPEAALGAMMGMVGLVWLINTLVSCAYEAFFVYQFAATPGKMALGLKVVRADGARVGLGRAIGRYFAKMLSAIILMIGYIIAGFDHQKRALHDMICDTRVIRVRT